MELELEATLPYLPEDVIMEILSRLPVKSLLCFKSVSKRWYSLIKSPSFIATHLQRYSHRNIQSILPTHTLRDDLDKADQHGICLLRDETTLEYHDLPFNIDPEVPIFYVNIAGSINGLVCISLNGDCDEIVLWNPAIRQYQHLPIPSIVCPPDERMHVSLGFGSYNRRKVNEYKLVRVVQILDEEHLHLVPTKSEVFSFSTGTWREIDVPLPPCECKMRVYGAAVVEGIWYKPVLEYIDDVTYGTFILSFDLEKEVFWRTEVPNPNEPNGYDLMVYKGLLALYFGPDNDSVGMKSKYDIWVMKNEANWEKMFSIEVPSCVSNWPIGTWKETKVLVTACAVEDEPIG